MRLHQYVPLKETVGYIVGRDMTYTNTYIIPMDSVLKRQRCESEALCKHDIFCWCFVLDVTVDCSPWANVAIKSKIREKVTH
jgi:hypothetical protein